MKNNKENLAMCEICGKHFEPRGMEVVNVNDKELFLCKTCVKNENMKNRQASENEAFDIIRIRYAKGEITKEQYDQMKKDLEK